MSEAIAADRGIVERPTRQAEGRSADAPLPDAAHIRALDGVRGLAVVGALLFHGGFLWAKGGYLGVSVFFTLSGFLITTLLLREWAGHGRIRLGDFWSRRFRRLMPAALFALTLTVLLSAWFATDGQLHNLRADVLSALGYVANWRFVLAGKSYADLWSTPSPVQHFWSLAIEEQFYLVYPLVVLGMLRLGGRRLLGGALGAVAVGSLLWSLHLRGSLDRVYYGTDTRLAELVAGGLFALWVFGRPRGREAPRTGLGRSATFAVGAIALAATIALWLSVSQTSHWVTRGVFPLQAALSVALIAVAIRPGAMARLLSIRPLPEIGLISYGLYLYHWPLFLVLDSRRTGLSGVALFAVRIGATFAVALASYFLLEQPIRYRRALASPRLVIPAAACAAALVVVQVIGVTWNVPPGNLAYATTKLGSTRATIERVAREKMPPVSGGVAAPASVMIVGDSGMYDVAPALGAMFKAMGTTTVVNAAAPGFGLTTEDNWKTDWPALVDQARPEVVFMMLGGWDRGYLEQRGAAAYESILGQALRLLTARGARVMLLGMPPGGVVDPVQIDAAFEREAATHPGFTAYVDTAPVLRAADGSTPRILRDANGTPILARKPDNFHFCPDGAARIAQLVGTQAAALGWSSAPRTDWMTGSWRSDPRYNDPKGGCDTAQAPGAPH